MAKEVFKVWLGHTKVKHVKSKVAEEKKGYTYKPLTQEEIDELLLFVGDKNFKNNSEKFKLKYLILLDCLNNSIWNNEKNHGKWHIDNNHYLKTKREELITLCDEICNELKRIEKEEKE